MPWFEQHCVQIVGYTIKNWAPFRSSLSCGTYLQWSSKHLNLVFWLQFVTNVFRLPIKISLTRLGVSTVLLVLRIGSLTIRNDNENWKKNVQGSTQRKKEGQLFTIEKHLQLYFCNYIKTFQISHHKKDCFLENKYSSLWLSSKSFDLLSKLYSPYICRCVPKVFKNVKKSWNCCEAGWKRS